VVAYWTGLSLEEVRSDEIGRVARDAGLQEPFVVTDRTGGSQFPLVSVEGEQGLSVVVDVRRARRADAAGGYKGFVTADKHTERAHQLRMLWFYELTRIAQSGGRP
jgi:hypothetical protein